MGSAKGRQSDYRDEIAIIKEDREFYQLQVDRLRQENELTKNALESANQRVIESQARIKALELEVLTLKARLYDMIAG